MRPCPCPCPCPSTLVTMRLHTYSHASLISHLLLQLIVEYRCIFHIVALPSSAAASWLAQLTKSIDCLSNLKGVSSGITRRDDSQLLDWWQWLPAQMYRARWMCHGTLSTTSITTSIHCPAASTLMDSSSHRDPPLHRASRLPGVTVSDGTPSGLCRYSASAHAPYSKITFCTCAKFRYNFRPRPDVMRCNVRYYDTNCIKW